MRSTIAVDIDDVLAVENEAVRQFMNDRYGPDHTPEDYLIEAEYWGYWEKAMGVDEQEGARRFQAYMDSDLKAKLGVLPGALEAIAWLKMRYDLAIVTSRQDGFIEATHTWLTEHFPDAFTRVEFVVLWSNDHKASKAAICDQIGANYLIDDNAEHCISAARLGVSGVLFGDYGWNRHAVLPANVSRARDWTAVLEYFYGIS